MVRAQASTLIRKPVDTCFRFVAVDFFRNYPRWSPEVVELKVLSGGRLRVGTMGHQVRVDQGRRSESSFRVILLQEGRRVTFQGISSPFLVDYRFEALADRTRLTFSFQLQRLELTMRPFERLIRVAAQDGAKRVVGNLKYLIEAEPEAMQQS
ncbi:MAG: SRPBCC family protein [Pseudomonadota bacterium]|nr:SRPBCC family protein [Pseudomonadota bacterium]